MNIETVAWSIGLYTVWSILAFGVICVEFVARERGWRDGTDLFVWSMALLVTFPTVVWTMKLVKG